MTESDKPIVWLHGVVKTPPFSKDARLEAGFYLRMLILETFAKKTGKTPKKVIEGSQETNIVI